MVDISEKLDMIIAEYIDEGKYFTVNRARQYGKTTMLYLLSFNFNQNKTTGIQEIVHDGKRILEVVV